MVASLLSQIPKGKRLPVVLGAACLLRLALFATSGSSHGLERRPELTSPLTSIRSLREGVYLYNHGIDPYGGGVFHHSPLYLFFFAHVLPVSSAAFTAALWTLADVMAAISLVSVWRSRDVSRSPRWEGRDYLVAMLYLFNPYTVLSCLARSTTTLDNVLSLGSIAAACNGGNISSMVLLALGTHTSLYPVILLAPLLLVLRSNSERQSSLLNIVVFVVSFALLALGATLWLGETWMSRTWGLILTASDLTPNVGMWWYFFTEIFDHFRIFFRGVFQLHLFIYIAPLCLRCREPLQAVLLLSSVISTWKSYPTLGDMALWAGLLACFPEYIEDLKHPLFSLTVHLYTAILLPLLHSLWLLTGAGNANFFYAATMVYGLNATLALADVLGAIISHDIKSQLGRVLGSSREPSVKDVAIVQLASLE